MSRRGPAKARFIRRFRKRRGKLVRANNNASVPSRRNGRPLSPILASNRFPSSSSSSETARNLAPDARIHTDREQYF